MEDPSDGRQRIADGALIPMLVKAIQELSAKNTALELELQHWRTQNDQSSRISKDG